MRGGVRGEPATETRPRSSLLLCQSVEPWEGKRGEGGREIGKEEEREREVVGRKEGKVGDREGQRVGKEEGSRGGMREREGNIKGRER